MKLFSTGQRSYIVDPKNIIKGGTYRKEDYERKWLYIEPKARFEVTDEYGTKLMKMYPDQFMQTDDTGIPLERKMKKTKKKVIAKKVVSRETKKAKDPQPVLMVAR